MNGKSGPEGVAPLVEGGHGLWPTHYGTEQESMLNQHHEAATMSVLKLPVEHYADEFNAVSLVDE